MSSNKSYSSWENEVYLFLIFIFMQHLICVTVCCFLLQGYDHSYFFIYSFMNDHIKHHAKYLNAWTATAVWPQPDHSDPAAIIHLFCFISPPTSCSTEFTRFWELNKACQLTDNSSHLEAFVPSLWKALTWILWEEKLLCLVFFWGGVVTATSLISGSILVSRLPACGFSSGLRAETCQSFIRIK